LQNAELIYSRDRAGLGETRALIGTKNTESKVRFCYDVGFIVDPVRPKAVDLDGFLKHSQKDFPIVGFNVSGLLFMGGYTQKNMFGLRIDYRKLVCDIIEHLIFQKGAAVLLVPHVFGQKEHAESDSAVCELIYSELKQKLQDRLYMVHGSYNHGEIKYTIGFCDFFIGSRMHACIAALSQNIPAVMIAYSKKFFGVMETIDMGNYVADPRIMDDREIVEVIDKAFENREMIKRRLEQKIPEVKARVLDLFNEIHVTLQQAEHDRI
jgi:polysaccharide pyruvyl transferase WcaK-like protein